MANFVDLINQQIHDFVHQPDNKSLRPGTGYFSTPFRGSLFGEEMSAAVAERLEAGDRVDVLWLGTNPCVQESLQYILGRPAGDGCFKSFDLQRKSGFFGSRKWDENEQFSPDWDPLTNPDHNWRLYRDVLERARLRAVAMANFIPWGSDKGAALVKHLGNTNGPLLKRLLAFADDVNVAIVEALNPRLIVMPISLRKLIKPGFGPELRHQVDIGGRIATISTSRWRRGRLTIPTVCAPHPSFFLYVGPDGRARFSDALSEVLRDLLCE